MLANPEVYFTKTQALSYQKAEKTGSKTHVALWPKTDTNPEV